MAEQGPGPRNGPGSSLQIPAVESIIDMENQGTIVTTQWITVGTGINNLSDRLPVRFSQALAQRIEAITFCLISPLAVDHVDVLIELPDERAVGSNQRFFPLRFLGNGGLPLFSPGGGWLLPAMKDIAITVRNRWTEEILLQLGFLSARYDAERLVEEGIIKR